MRDESIQIRFSFLSHLAVHQVIKGIECVPDRGAEHIDKWDS